MRTTQYTMLLFGWIRRRNPLLIFAKIVLIGILFITIELLLGSQVYGQTPQINMRLRLVSHTYHAPIAGQAALVVATEFICTDPAGCQVDACQAAFQVDTILNAQVTMVSFASGGSPYATKTQDYRATDGRIRFIFTDYTTTIPNAWTPVLTTTIQYTMINQNGAITWFDGVPIFYVADSSSNNITGSKEAIPGDLTSIPLTTSDPATQKVNTRLRLVNHTYNTPMPGLGTLEIAVEYSCNESAGCSVFTCSDAFQLNALLNAQVHSVALSDPGIPNLAKTLDYAAATGRIRYLYTPTTGNYLMTIPETWTLILTATIQYTMTDQNGAAIMWYDGPPEFEVIASTNDNITGLEEAIPEELSAIPLTPESPDKKVNARLRLISHTYDYPTPGLATLIMVEEFLCTELSGCSISGCNSATIQLDPTLNAQVSSVSFTFPDFGDVVVKTEGTDYRALDGRIRFIYCPWGLYLATIPKAGMVMLTVTIQYTMTEGNGAFLWYTGVPTFFVADTYNKDITGSKEAIPADLISIPLSPSSSTTNSYMLWTK